MPPHSTNGPEAGARGVVLRVARDTHVVLDYALYDDEGELIEATDDPDLGANEPIRYVHGYGSLVPGLERGLIGMAPGDTKEIVVQPDEAYGPWDEAADTWVDRSEFPPDVEIDDEFRAEQPDGSEITLRVAELADDAVLVTTNHPLAGEVLTFDVVVREVRPASADELAKARAKAPKTLLPLVEAGASATAAEPAADATRAARDRSTSETAQPRPNAAPPRPERGALDRPTRQRSVESVVALSDDEQ
jgi:FKBP-type peptidyl-prolyl cis-trans isomerase SlyD